MEELSSTTNPTLFHLLGLIEILSSPMINTLGKTAMKFWSSLQYRFELGNSSNIWWAEAKTPDADLSTRQNSSFDGEGENRDWICRGDVEMVIRNLGLCCGGEVQERFAPEDMTRLFEEKEPSLEEVKEAFYVFDVNRDGFIDADELQIVLCGLGFSEGKETEDCQTMIRSFDENGDGRIDFREFVKFMENCFC